MQLARVGPKGPISRFVRNLFHAIKALTVVDVNVDDQGNVGVVYAGSFMRLRADGNVDVVSSRNFLQVTKGVIHHNPLSIEHDDYTDFESLEAAYPELYAVQGHGQHPAALALQAALAGLPMAQQETFKAWNALASYDGAEVNRA